MLRFLILFVALLFSKTIVGQISPPGLDDTNVVAWGAIGVSQQISNKWTVIVYAGAARESDPDNEKLLHKQAIFVFNQETQYQFNKYWQLSFCSSLRSQKRYTEDPPYELQSPPIRDEVRNYLRLYYRHTLGKVSMTYSFRPEYRSFYDTHWHAWDSNPTELRFRIKAHASIPLNELKSNQFIVGNEFLSATDNKRNSNHELYWSTYRFTEDRFTTYLRHVFKKPSIIVDAGVMHQVKFDPGNTSYIAQFAFDIIVQNPFGKLKAQQH